MSPIAKPALTRLFVALISVAGLTGVSACGDIQNVDLGDFRCVSQPCEANFGEVNLNRPGEAAKIDITNIGNGELNLLSISIVDTSPRIHFSDSTVRFIGDETGFDWRVDAAGQNFENTSPFVLVRNERLEIEIVFDPGNTPHGCPGEIETDGTIECGEIVIVSNDVDADEAEIRAPILLNIGASRMEVSPTTISFSPAQILDAASGTYATQERSFTVSNIGTGNMQLQNINPASAELSFEDASGGNGVGSILTSGVEREFLLTWTPTSEEPLESQVTITSNAVAGGTRVILVNSEGGESAGIQIDPCDFFFDETAVGDTTEILFDVTNTGAAPMTWQTSITGVRPTAARTDFNVRTADDQDSLGPQDSLAPDGTRTLKLVYSPSEERSVSGSLRFTGNFGSLVTCPFAAGEAICNAEVSPAQLYWGGVASGEASERTFVVHNSGRAIMNVSGIAVSGDAHGEWAVDALSSGGFTVAPGASHRVTVTYTRAVDDLPAQDTATLSIDHDCGTAGQVFLIATHGDQFLPPTCNLAVNPDEPYDLGELVTLDATGSELNAGEWATNKFQWNLVAPSGSSASLSTTSGDRVTWTPDVAGTYVVSLVGTALVDGESLSCEVVRSLVATE